MNLLRARWHQLLVRAKDFTILPYAPQLCSLPLASKMIVLPWGEVQSSVLDHPLPQAKRRANVVTEQYIPRGRPFGGCTTRGQGATCRFPEVVKAIHSVAQTRPKEFAPQNPSFTRFRFPCYFTFWDSGNLLSLCASSTVNVAVAPVLSVGLMPFLFSLPLCLGFA